MAAGEKGEGRWAEALNVRCGIATGRCRPRREGGAKKKGLPGSSAPPAELLA